MTFGFATNPSGGTLTGFLARNAVSGVAIFSDLTVDNVGSGYHLSASATSLDHGFDPALTGSK